LGLIAEYRARNNIAEIRQLYERFLVVFPQAVSQETIRTHSFPN